MPWRTSETAAATAADRFEKYVAPEPNTGCFLWIGGILKNGYGLFHAGRLIGAHRYASFTEENTYRRPSGGRACRRCARAQKGR